MYKIKLHSWFDWFFIGIFSAILGFISEIIFLNIFYKTSEIENIIQFNFLNFFFFFSIFIEEITKIIFVYLYLKTHQKNKLPVFSASFLSGIGFAFLETILLYYKNTTITFFPLISIYFVHIITFSVAIFFLRQKQNLTEIIKALIITLLIHSVYNLIIFYF